MTPVPNPINPPDGLSQAQLAARIGISQPRVCQLERRALARLRELLGGDPRDAREGG